MSRTDNIRQLLADHGRRLQLLKTQQARQGYNTSPEIITEIEDIELAIDNLQTELQTLGGIDPQAVNQLPVDNQRLFKQRRFGRMGLASSVSPGEYRRRIQAIIEPLPLGLF